MVAEFLRLKLAIVAGRFRRNPRQLIVIGFVVAYAAIMVVLATIGLVLLRVETAEVARTIVIVFGSFVVLSFLLLPLAFGVDDPMDPRRFALFGIPPLRLSIGLAVAGLVSLPSVIVVMFAVGQLGTWSVNAGSAVLALLSAVLIIITCVLASRVSSALASVFLAGRRRREVVGVVLGLAGVGLATVCAYLATLDWQSAGLPVMRRIAAITTWTPLGAAWSIPADAVAGMPEQVVPKVLISLGFVALLAGAWWLLVRTMGDAPERVSAPKSSTGLGWFDRLPATPAGVIAARSFTYWGRDSRYVIALAVIPIVPIVMVIALLVGGVPAHALAWIPVPVMSLFLGWMLHNDVALDSTAFWSHVSANTSGVADRWGRLIPALVVGVPLLVIGSIITAAITGDWSTLPGLIGLAACLLLSGLGVASIVSAAAPYPAVHPGDSPFAQPQVTTGVGTMAQAAAFFGPVVLAAPVVVFVVLGAIQGGGWYFGALLLGLAIGLVTLGVGVRVGGRLVRKRGPELLAFALRN